MLSSQKHYLYVTCVISTLFLRGEQSTNGAERIGFDVFLQPQSPWTEGPPSPPRERKTPTHLLLLTTKDSSHGHNRDAAGYNKFGRRRATDDSNLHHASVLSHPKLLTSSTHGAHETNMTPAAQLVKALVGQTACLVFCEGVLLLVKQLVQFWLQRLRHVWHRDLDYSFERLLQSGVLRSHLRKEHNVRHALHNYREE